MNPRRLRGEAGFVAGLESLAFGVLVFLLGTLVVLNGWAVVDAKFATNAAAREAVRTVVQAEVDASPAELQAAATSAARQAVTAHGLGAERLTLTPDAPVRMERCAEVAFTAEVRVRSTIVPGLWRTPSWRVGSRYADVIDPFRSGLEVDGWKGCGFAG